MFNPSFFRGLSALIGKPARLSRCASSAVVPSSCTSTIVVESLLNTMLPVASVTEFSRCTVPRVVTDVLETATPS